MSTHSNEAASSAAQTQSDYQFLFDPQMSLSLTTDNNLQTEGENDGPERESYDVEIVSEESLEEDLDESINRGTPSQLCALSESTAQFPGSVRGDDETPTPRTRQTHHHAKWQVVAEKLGVRLVLKQLLG